MLRKPGFVPGKVSGTHDGHLMILVRSISDVDAICEHNSQCLFVMFVHLINKNQGFRKGASQNNKNDVVFIFIENVKEEKESEKRGTK